MEETSSEEPVSGVTLDAVLSPGDDVVAREVDGNLVLVPLVAGLGDVEAGLLTLNETGRAVWELLDGRRTLREVAARIAERFGAPLSQVEPDVLSFASELLGSGARGDARFASDAGELRLTDEGQLGLLAAVTGRGAAFRTTVRGGSMSPFVRDGDVVTIEPRAGRIPGVGEVVAFAHPVHGRLVIHRVVARAAGGWLLRGDACAVPDGVVEESRVVGFVARVERRGRTVFAGVGRGGATVAVLSRSGTLGLLLRVARLPRRVASALRRRVGVRRPGSGQGPPGPVRAPPGAG